MVYKVGLPLYRFAYVGPRLPGLVIQGCKKGRANFCSPHYISPLTKQMKMAEFNLNPAFKWFMKQAKGFSEVECVLVPI
ncbi:hypothetical protein ILYODFUR_030540 [Ilyodon furcidens]|uniref:Uncharacterized protein n=1 Tax=Ilyodon furcidens TaxID=33524 RepID=A0ABV0T4Z2_9TELE